MNALRGMKLHPFFNQHVGMPLCYNMVIPPWFGAAPKSSDQLNLYIDIYSSGG